MVRTFLTAGLLAFAGLQAAFAQTEPPRPVLAHNVNSIWFENWVGLSSGMLRVATPAGEIETVFETSRSPVYRLSGAGVVDGVYRFELRAATTERIPNTNKLPPGLTDEKPPETVAKPFYASGGFLVERGAIVRIPQGDEGDDG